MGTMGRRCRTSSGQWYIDLPPDFDNTAHKVPMTIIRCQTVDS